MSRAEDATLQLYNWIKAEQGIYAVFFTSRPSWCKQQTLDALYAAGYEDVGSDAVIFCGVRKPPPVAPKDQAAAQEKKSLSSRLSPHYHHRKTTAEVTAEALAAFEKDESDGFRRRIIMIVGDQNSDFPVAGEENKAVISGAKVLHVKLPNYCNTFMQ